MTGVAIVGGGPAGLMLAIELGVRGVPCTLFDENAGPPTLPKANATSSRTMEHFRRRGFAARIRERGLPPDHPQDIVYTTRLARHELTRFRIPSSSDAANRRSFGDYGEAAWPTPELPHRVQQMFVERVLRDEVARYPSVTRRFGTRVDAVRERDAGVEVDAHDIANGQPETLVAHYAVGCDGPRSAVRAAIGASYRGEGGVQRDFMGGNMVTFFFRSPDFANALGKAPAWMYWALNPVQRAVAVSVDGSELFGLAIQLRPGESADSLDAQRVFDDTVGVPFRYELLARTPWSAGLSLVADTFSSRRLMIAGDAAHLFTPTGGMGYNTSIDDAVNLGWKLAAVLQGAASASLLESYGEERRPIATRNTSFAATMAESIGRMPVTPTIEDDSVEAAHDRSTLGTALAAHVASEFNIPGLQLGVRYASSIVAAEAGSPPVDNPNHYVPSGYPGARAPHVTLDGAALFDRFGRDFTLLTFDEDATDAWKRAAHDHGVMLDVVAIRDDYARELYGADHVLVRPDHHVAWRGNGTEASGVFTRTLGGRA